MGKDVFEASAAARRVFESADARLGFSVSRLCFDGPDADLVLTKNTQPAIVTTSCALLAALQEALPELPSPQAAAGHSLGEYSALVASGAMSSADAAQLVRLRGEAMQQAVPPGVGTMVAIMGGDGAAVEQLCVDARQGEVLSPANFNCPGQIVIAGHAAAGQRAVELAKERRLKAIPLKVSAPFHCALMAPAAERLRSALSDSEFGPLSFPVVSNVEATPNSDSSRVAELLVRQVDGAVRWQQTIEWLEAQAFTHALEIGPGQVLSGLVKKTSKSIAVHSVRDLDTLRRVPEFLAS